jgi:Plasmid pRiA4b ORF-3-like protein
MSNKFQRVQVHTVYQLRIELQHIAPLIWRRILVPNTLKLSKLDRVVQAAMGWDNSHLHDWHIGSQRYGVPDEEWIGTSTILDERKLELTRFRGHIMLCVQGVTNVQSTTAVPGGVPPADGRVGSSRPLTCAALA